MKIKDIDCGCVSAKIWNKTGKRKFQVLVYRPKDDIKTENWDGRIFDVANFIDERTGTKTRHFLVKDTKEANTLALMSDREFDNACMDPKYNVA